MIGLIYRTRKGEIMLIEISDNQLVTGEITDMEQVYDDFPLTDFGVVSIERDGDLISLADLYAITISNEEEEFTALDDLRNDDLANLALHVLTEAEQEIENSN